MARISQKEIVHSMKELSSSAFKLLMYYYSRNDGWIFKDSEIAKAIDSTERMVKKYRKELIDNGYLLIQRGEVDVYFIGKDSVQEFITHTPTDFMEDESVPPPIYSIKS